MAFQYITYEKKNKVATITLNTPPLNWLTIVMMKEINEALVDVKKDASMQLLVFDHAGEKAFSSGVDVADHTDDKVDEMIEVFHGMFRHHGGDRCPDRCGRQRRCPRAAAAR